MSRSGIGCILLTVMCLLTTAAAAEEETHFVELPILQAQYAHTHAITQAPAWAGSPQGFSFGEFFVSNNAWNRRGVPHFSQTVFANEDGSEIGWTWDWPTIEPEQVRSFPYIVIGKTPARAASTTARLPIRLSDVEACRLSYAVETVSSGKSNTAFDVWITDDASASRDSVVMELMIWIDDCNMVEEEDIANPRARINDQLVPFHYIERMPHGHWAYALFIVEDEGNLNVLPFIRYLIEEHYLNDDLFLASIDFGNEIVSGTGLTVVKDLVLDLRATD